MTRNDDELCPIIRLMFKDGMRVLVFPSCHAALYPSPLFYQHMGTLSLLEAGWISGGMEGTVTDATGDVGARRIDQSGRERLESGVWLLL